MTNVLKVEGMSCGHCVKAIEGALSEIGVTGSVDLTNKTVTVEYDEAQKSLKDIKATIEDAGYDVI
ncbi:heavy-metal-associated domain-containing protein [Tumebacillus sp. ITR2]|uniref:Heavy-metal-associated domain-containing protein n=1 Tax=Tumebacillus amylolyticus TaxID=2801339 RepID=A0ABS1J5K6_9BACL|nr:cation transporter [Tumebacillus amylolyticus]MBL0385563.1 heavy-metal-associated domain-containing protein [Tumebacillus amylolyticus]